MDDEVVFLVLSVLAFVGFFGPRFLRELALLLGRAPRESLGREESRELRQEVQGLRQEITELRRATGEKLLSLEMRMLALSRPQLPPQTPQALEEGTQGEEVSRTLAERVTHQTGG